MVIIHGNHICAPVRLPRPQCWNTLSKVKYWRFLFIAESADAASNFNRRSGYYGGSSNIPLLLILSSLSMFSKSCSQTSSSQTANPASDFGTHMGDWKTPRGSGAQKSWKSNISLSRVKLRSLAISR